MAVSCVACAVFTELSLNAVAPSSYDILYLSHSRELTVKPAQTHHLAFEPDFPVHSSFDFIRFE